MAPRLVLIALLSLAWLVPVARADFSLRYRLVERLDLGNSSEVRLHAADFDGDGHDDLLYARQGRAICETVYSGARHVLWDADLDSAGVVGMVGDATGDGRADLLVVRWHAGAYWISCRDPAGPGGVDRARWTAGPFLGHCLVYRKSGTVGDVTVPAVLDGDGDGRPEVYVQTYPFEPGTEPRRILCLDGATGREDWRYELAGCLSGMRLLTRRGGAERHLLVSTYGPENGFVLNGRDDAHGYVISLAPDGREEWCREMGVGFCSVEVALGDLDGDGWQDLVVTPGLAGLDPAGNEAGSLLVLDPRTGATLKQRRMASSAWTVRAADLDRDGRSEILVPGRDQRLRCYDSGLRLKWETGGEAESGLGWVADMDGDGRQEVVSGSQSIITILDAKGRLLCAKKLPGQGWRALVSIRGRECIAAVAPHYGYALQLEPPTVWPAGLVVGGGALLLGSGGAAYAVRRRRRRAEEMVTRSEAQDRLLEAMMAFGHAGSSLGVLHRLHLHLRNWERVRTQESARQALAALLGDLEDSVLPALVRLVALARRARANPQHWRPLAERALVVSSAVHEVLDGGGGAAEPVRRAAAALEQADACLAGLRGHLRQVFRAPVEPALRRALARHTEALTAAGVEVCVEPCHPDGVAVFAAPDQLDGVLENLLDNAMRAMRDSATRRLAIAVGLEGAYCRVDVTDSGCGIAEDEHERIFDRGYTTREGGGFGLYFARQTLARYEGKIFVARSAPGEGTTLRVMLRAA